MGSTSFGYATLCCFFSPKAIRERQCVRIVIEVGTPTRNQLGQNLFEKNRFLVGPGGAPKLGGNFLFRWGMNF